VTSWMWGASLGSLPESLGERAYPIGWALGAARQADSDVPWGASSPGRDGRMWMTGPKGVSG